MLSEQNKPHRVANSGGLPIHFNGTALVAGSTILMEVDGNLRLTTALLIKNVDASDSLEIILDGGANGYILPASESIYLPCSVSEITLKGIVGDADYQIIATF